MKITNCKLYQHENNLPYEQDNISVSGNGGNFIMGNYFYHGGTNPIPHKDMIQYNSTTGSSNNYLTTIADNFFYYNSQYAAAASSGIYLAGVHNNRFLIYNNIITLNATNGIVGICIYAQSLSYHVSIREYNNTVITGDPNSTPFVIGYCDTLDFRNNIALSDSGASSNRPLTFIQQGISKIQEKIIDFNNYHVNNQAFDTDNNGTIYSWKQWQSMGYDSNGSINSHILLKNGVVRQKATN